MRRRLRERRRSLPPRVRRRAERRAADRLFRRPEIRRARHIALFLSADGEPETADILRRARQASKRVYLPVVLRGRGRMAFARHAPGVPLRPNRYGIPEPSVRCFVLRRTLDVIVAPLVGFDDDGRRLGMGGGYYDRYLATLAKRRRFRRPRVVGLAFECQRVPAVPRNPWDVSADIVVTEDRPRHGPISRRSHE